jgi:hypothetical protein
MIADMVLAGVRAARLVSGLARRRKDGGPTKFGPKHG